MTRGCLTTSATTQRKASILLAEFSVTAHEAARHQAHPPCVSAIPLAVIFAAIIILRFRAAVWWVGRSGAVALFVRSLPIMASAASSHPLPHPADRRP
jgi:hypothetical protein